jgi:hypothetical protein
MIGPQMLPSELVQLHDRRPGQQHPPQQKALTPTSPIFPFRCCERPADRELSADFQ